MNINDHLGSLFEILSIPSISAQSKHKKAMDKVTLWLKNKFESLGFKSEILPTAGHPLVFAEPTSYNQRLPTILIYGHYDVQSEDPLKEWISEPFKPEIRSGNIYGRGAADDKGQLYTWIAAIEELRTMNDELRTNVKFLIEGEEEVGSKNLTEFIQDNKALLKADVCVLSDTHCLTETQPLIDYGLRGIVYTQVSIKTLSKDVHSGIYGGNVLNPANVLAQIISKLKDENHKVLIPGFYDHVRKLGVLERRKLSQLPFKEAQVTNETGAKAVVGEKGFSVHERAGARPTLEINGIWGGYQGEGPKTIIPGEAHAKISMRIVPNQSSDEIYKKFEKYVKKTTPKGVDIQVDLISTAEPVIVNTESRYFKNAEKAYEKVFGKRPLYELSGGTIGVVADFKNILGIDSVMMGYGLPDDGLHSPNEKLSLKMFEKGIKTNIEFLKSL